MRRSYLVCYDVCDAKRLRRIHRLMKAYGEPWQYSVFYCVLKAIDRVRLENAARAELNLREDQLLIVDLGGDDGAARDAASVIGQRLPEAESGVIVI
jgi:CRISPR-associated protein Cas2